VDFEEKLTLAVIHLILLGRKPSVDIQASVFLDFAGNLRDTAALGTIPSAFSDSDRVAINNFDQVAYLGSNSDGRQAIFRITWVQPARSLPWATALFATIRNMRSLDWDSMPV